ncbi:SoxR reducing system RseC family protein [Propionivibrio dicarboxylicus]|uniref:Positive regulator of sigma(E), RseC/MucC n=1 Tax=Propionivibrio dicarboxylicus TaxID=83767 RepID=A0A1G8D532_9RHOO|nr:SoxR reducing system RseC family protein [Propionivibrio dicarboxylicus]SDH52812.1 positive regulator of sigma(E), RseC/MucC [Propionivibrio dicarboxylicus]
MIETVGVVAACEGDRVLVRVEQKGCGRCHEEGGCGGNNLGNLLCKSPESFWLKNPGGLAVGDTVTVAIAEGALYKTVTRAYLIPLLGLLVGAIIGMFLYEESGAIVGAVLGLFVSWFGTRRRGGQSFDPFIKR